MAQEPTKDVQLKLRFSEDQRVRWAEASERNGTSLNSEIIRRVEDTIRLDASYNNPATVSLLANLAKRIVEIEKLTGKSWNSDAYTYGAVRYAMEEELDLKLPLTDEVYQKAKSVLKQHDDVDYSSRLVRDYQNGSLPEFMRPFVEREYGNNPVEYLDGKLKETAETKDAILAPIYEEVARGRDFFQAILDREADERRARKGR